MDPIPRNIPIDFAKAVEKLPRPGYNLAQYLLMCSEARTIGSDNQLVLWLRVLFEDVVFGKTVTKACMMLLGLPYPKAVVITAIGPVAVGSLGGKMCGKFFFIDSTHSIKCHLPRFLWSCAPEHLELKIRDL
jgi:hypothetical protein